MRNIERTEQAKQERIVTLAKEMPSLQMPQNFSTNFAMRKRGTVEINSPCFNRALFSYFDQ